MTTASPGQLAPPPTSSAHIVTDQTRLDELQAFAHGFVDLLTREKFAEAPVIDRARRAAQSTGERLDHVLTKLGLISDTDVVKALSTYLAIPVATLDDVPAEPLLTDIVTADFVRRNRIVPLVATDDALTIGVVDPLNLEPVRALAYLTGRPTVARLFVAADFEKALQALYTKSASGFDGVSFGDNSDASETDVQRLRDIASEAPTIRLVNQIIAAAVERQASDIHIEPALEAVLVRYRVDGLLRTAQSLPPGMRAAITSRIKIMAKLDIAERRMPQDGRIKLAIRGVDIDFRISTIPTAFGESVVMRILDRSRIELDFVKLGFSSDHIDTLRELMRQPNGIILVTGPTGSGKTTTLYTALKELNSPDRKVFTVEDPIEYQLGGINQVQVQPAIGLTFPHALRSILRQDPDIVMIGEIRDLETARIAIQASLTGHLVLSTLHTNSAAATITRLIDMGLENYLLASTVKGILAQRLVRKLCPHCARPHRDAEYWAERLSNDTRNRSIGERLNIREPTGCSECAGHGFIGRSTIAEILVVDAPVHRHILSATSDMQISDFARTTGMISMYENGVTKVRRGETTIDEVLRATRVG
ncbi:GspE/PulE family protein [Bradyrhizobium sp. INPA03-11B]|uniref:GspE/PulE family protein n=1 Tax=Bradyrhizobium sp. INPA03-11B TaxID=418598 RepID=UPI00338DBECB